MNKKYLIFGATGSIGSSLANQMHKEKQDCHLIGRNEKELKEIANKLNYSYSVCDVMKINFADKLLKDLSETEIIALVIFFKLIFNLPFQYSILLKLYLYLYYQKYKQTHYL